MIITQHKGAGLGGPDLKMVKIEVYVVFDRGEPQLQDAFYPIKKYCSQPKSSHFEILKIQVISNYSTRADSDLWRTLKEFIIIKDQKNHVIGADCKKIAR